MKMIKYSLLFLFLSNIATAQKTDTVKIVLMVSDTADGTFKSIDYSQLVKSCDTCILFYAQPVTKFKNNGIYWISAYEVRKIEEKEETVYENPNHISPNGSSTLMALISRRTIRKEYSHKSYLDADKMELAKSILIWQKL